MVAVNLTKESTEHVYVSSQYPKLVCKIVRFRRLSKNKNSFDHSRRSFARAKPRHKQEAFVPYLYIKSIEECKTLKRQ